MSASGIDFFTCVSKDVMLPELKQFVYQRLLTCRDRFKLSLVSKAEAAFFNNNIEQAIFADLNEILTRCGLKKLSFVEFQNILESCEQIAKQKKLEKNKFQIVTELMSHLQDNDQLFNERCEFNNFFEYFFEQPHFEGVYKFKEYLLYKWLLNQGVTTTSEELAQPFVTKDNVEHMHIYENGYVLNKKLKWMTALAKSLKEQGLVKYAEQLTECVRCQQDEFYSTDQLRLVLEENFHHFTEENKQTIFRILINCRGFFINYPLSAKRLYGTLSKLPEEVAVKLLTKILCSGC